MLNKQIRKIEDKEIIFKDFLPNDESKNINTFRPVFF